MGTSQRDDSPPGQVVRWFGRELSMPERPPRRGDAQRKGSETSGKGEGNGRQGGRGREGDSRGSGAGPAITADLPTIVLQDLAHSGTLLETLGEPLALKYLEELGSFVVQVQQSGSLARTMLDRYGVKQLDEMPALQIVESVSGVFDPDASGRAHHSALRAALQTLDSLLGEPAKLPIASPDEIQDYVRRSDKTLRVILIKFYAAYLSQIADYHYTQVAPRFLGPKKGAAMREQSRQTEHGDDAICEKKAQVLADILDRACSKYKKCRLDDLETLDPRLLRSLIAESSDEIRMQLADQDK